MHMNRSVNIHSFSMVPRNHVPRSVFKRQTTHKTTFNSGYLIPILVDEILPGDSMRVNMTAFARLVTPIYPIMDNAYLDSHFFFVPCRLVWTNWEKFQGAQDNPGDSISYTIPTVGVTVAQATVGSLYDYFGIPTAGQLGATKTVNSLPFRCYNLIWKEWFRAEDIQNSPVINNGNGPDTVTDYALLRRGKRHDYFTACLPWPQKGGVAVSAGLAGNARVKGDSDAVAGPRMERTGHADQKYITMALGSANVNFTSAAGASGQAFWTPDDQGLYADLTTATGVTINSLRTSITIQQLLERDARGGTRYVEQLRNRWGTNPGDLRMMRPEYLGGGSSRLNVAPVAQTSATGLTGGTTPTGNLSAIGTALANNHGFSQTFAEHGYVIGLISVRADLTYQQGLRRMWTRSTRYDFAMPEFNNIGEQSVRNDEIYCDGSGNDTATFAYQERYSEYKHFPSMISGLFRSTAASTLDGWHLAQKFTSLPTLNTTFIQDTPPIDRISAVPASATSSQLYCDTFFDITHARPLPVFNVPGLNRL